MLVSCESHFIHNKFTTFTVHRRQGTFCKLWDFFKYGAEMPSWHIWYNFLEWPLGHPSCGGLLDTPLQTTTQDQGTVSHHLCIPQGNGDLSNTPVPGHLELWIALGNGPITHSHCAQFTWTAIVQQHSGHAKVSKLSSGQLHIVHVHRFCISQLGKSQLWHL